VHPSAASYRHCYEVFKQQVPLQSVLATVESTNGNGTSIW
jgi:hypothetical protein